MRKALAGLAVLAVLAAAWALGVRRVPPGAAAWNASTGELLAAGDAPRFAAAWRWRQVAAAAVTAEVQATSLDGARVGVRVACAFPQGSHTLAPAPEPDVGLAAAIGEQVRAAVAALPLACVTGEPRSACPEPPATAIARALAARLAIPEGAVSVQLAADPHDAAVARLASLRGEVGTPRRRVLLVGWDGADWGMIEPLVRRGAMPNLARLMAEGSWGELESFTPLLSPLIWTTMATGVSPDAHGILDFVEVDPESGAKVPITGRQRKVPALWNMATAAGLSVNVSGWWASWPAEPVNGVLVSDRLFFLLSDAVAEAPQGTVVWPAEREDEFRRLAARAESETDAKVVRGLLPVSEQAYDAAVAARRGMQDPIDGFRRIMVGTRTYFASSLQAAEDLESPAALTMVYAIGTDEIGHLLAPYLPPPLPGADPAFSAIARTGAERYFAVADRWLGRLVETCAESACSVLLVSDHGFKWGADRPREFSGTAAATAALWHRPRGIFVLAGKDVRKLGKVAEAPSVYDVAPTVAALLGLPPGLGWRGKPLPGCPPQAHAPVDWSALVPPGTYRRTAPAQPSAEYLKQLKSLGYLEGGEGTGKGGAATEGELNNLGLVHLEAKRYAEAEKAFRSAIERNPAYASPHYNLRRLYFETGRFDEADAELWRAVDLKLRDAVGAADRAAGDYESRGEPARAAALLEEARRRFPREARLAVHLLALLVRTNRCPEAVAEGNAAARAFPVDAHVQAFLGLAAACAGDAEGARRAFGRSLDLDPNQPEIRQALEALPGGR